MNPSFDLSSAQKASREEAIAEWVQRYLRSGHWVNLGLADGLLLAPRWWLGPFPATLNSLSRKCGLETPMEYVVPINDWNAHVDEMASTLTKLEDLPPLIVEWRDGRWFIADGNHRHEALRRKGYKSCWAVGWLNSEEDFFKAQSSI